VNGALGGRTATDDKSTLTYVRKARTGFTPKSAMALRERLDALRPATSPIPRLRDSGTILGRQLEAEFDIEP
jgi:hypothetical protein